MNELAATWPFSAGDDFYMFVVVVAALLAGVGVLAAILVGQLLDGPIRTVDNAEAAPASLSTSPLSSSVTASMRTDKLVVGRLPHGDELWLVAWLRGGRRRLETVLFVAARRAGWLRVLPGDRLDVVMDVDPPDPLLARFKIAVARTAATARWPVHAAGAELEPLVRDEAIEADVARPQTRNLVLQGVALVGVVVVIALLVVQGTLVDRGLVKGLGLVPLLWLIPLALCAYGAVAVGGTAFVLRDHRQAMAYLRWLDGVVDAIRADVRAGVPVRDEDLLIVAALDGEHRLGETGEKLDIDVLTVAGVIVKRL